jgi:hypothetical protein
MGNRDDGINTSTFYHSAYHNNRSKDEALPLAVSYPNRISVMATLDELIPADGVALTDPINPGWSAIRKLRSR